MANRRRPTTRGSLDRTSASNCAAEPYVEDWDQYFLGIARAVAQKSKDPNCRVGAVIVSPDYLVLSTGFNGLARGVYDDEHLLETVDEKLKWICHAEANAISNAARSGVSVMDSTIFVTKFPCFLCCNAIVQAGVTRIYTHDDRFWADDPVDGDKPEYRSSKRIRTPHSQKRALLKQADIQVDAPNHPTYNARWRVPPARGKVNGSWTQLELPEPSGHGEPPRRFAPLAKIHGRRKSSLRSRAS
ncbi:MAG: deoxycytidylate deaminase [Gammaproteobacteria bacterium]